VRHNIISPDNLSNNKQSILIKDGLSQRRHTTPWLFSPEKQYKSNIVAGVFHSAIIPHRSDVENPEKTPLSIKVVTKNVAYRGDHPNRLVRDKYTGRRDFANNRISCKKITQQQSISYLATAIH